MAEGDKQLNPGAVKPQLPARNVKFLHQKAPQYTTYHADGAWGIIGSGGNVNMHFDVEYPKLADNAVNPVDPAGNFTGEVEVQGAGELHTTR